MVIRTVYEAGEAEFLLEVFSPESGTEVEFKAVIGQNGKIESIVTTTPYRTSFRAYRYVAMFEALDPANNISVTVITQRDGQEISRSGFTSQYGGIVENLVSGEACSIGAIF